MSSAEVSYDFSGSRVLVTGGSSGIGTAIATGFADAGARVSITGTRGAASEYDTDLARFAYHPLQMTDKGAIEELAEQLDGLDILVNNAGANFPGGKNEAIPDVFEERNGFVVPTQIPEQKSDVHQDIGVVRVHSHRPLEVPRSSLHVTLKQTDPADHRARVDEVGVQLEAALCGSDAHLDSFIEGARKQ